MSIRYAILGLLHYADMHGYRIKEHLEKNFGHMWTVNFGQIYPNLRALERDGLIRMKGISPSKRGGPQKKLYTIEEQGRKEFARWLAQEPVQPMILRDSFLLKFAFFGFGGDDRALEIIKEQIAVHEKQLERRKAKQQRWNRQGIYVRLLAQLGVALNEAYLQWLRQAASEVKNHEESLKTGSAGG